MSQVRIDLPKVRFKSKTDNFVCASPQFQQYPASRQVFLDRLKMTKEIRNNFCKALNIRRKNYIKPKPNKRHDFRLKIKQQKTTLHTLQDSPSLQFQLSLQSEHSQELQEDCNILIRKQKTKEFIKNLKSKLKNNIFFDLNSKQDLDRSESSTKQRIHATIQGSRCTYGLLDMRRSPLRKNRRIYQSPVNEKTKNGTFKLGPWYNKSLPSVLGESSLDMSYIL